VPLRADVIEGCPRRARPPSPLAWQLGGKASRRRSQRPSRPWWRPEPHPPRSGSLARSTRHGRRCQQTRS